MTVTDYELRIVRYLNRKIGTQLRNKIEEFPNAEHILNDTINIPLIRKQKAMRLENGLYSPRMDVAVGPYAFLGYTYANWDDNNYEQLLRVTAISNLVDKLLEHGHVLPEFSREHNLNPRCLFSIEIENANDYKHNLGSIANCSIMGKIGVYIDYDSRRLLHFYNFLSEMIRRKKTKMYLNVIFLSKEEFDRVMRPRRH